jgi:hypothetical protein
MVERIWSSVTESSGASNDLSEDMLSDLTDANSCLVSHLVILTLENSSRILRTSLSDTKAADKGWATS